MNVDQLLEKIEELKAVVEKSEQAIKSANSAIEDAKREIKIYTTCLEVFQRDKNDLLHYALRQLEMVQELITTDNTQSTEALNSCGLKRNQRQVKKLRKNLPSFLLKELTIISQAL